MILIAEIASGILLAIGSLLLLSGAVGLLRFPDFYTRMHAAGVTDTLAAMCIILGLMLISDWNLSLVKLTFILLFILITSPTASHALARAAQYGGLVPESKDSKTNDSKTRADA